MSFTGPEQSHFDSLGDDGGVESAIFRDELVESKDETSECDEVLWDRVWDCISILV
jgi:hypothetical protein